MKLFIFCMFFVVMLTGISLMPLDPPLGEYEFLAMSYGYVFGGVVTALLFKFENKDKDDSN